MTATSERKRVAIVGGGITGLSAAYELRDANVDVTLLEASERLGGKILTHQVAGVPVEAGADWFLTRQPAALELCRRLGLEDDLVPPDRSGAYIWSRGGLHKMIPQLVRGVPTRPKEAAEGGLVSKAAAMRASLELLNLRPLRGPDVSVGSFVRKRFGHEVMERLVDPMLAASRSGSADEMSLAAAAPELDAAARSHRSVLSALRQAPSPSSDNPPFLGLRGGMSRLSDALVAHLTGLDIRVGTQVAEISRANDRYLVDGVEADTIILAVPAHAAASLTRSLDTDLARELGRIHFEPAVVVTLAFPPGSGPPPADGSGVLVPSGEKRLLTACAWFSEKWRHAKPDDGSLIVRCFVGRKDALEFSDNDLIAGVTEELRAIAGINGSPREHSVVRWEAALPVFRVGHNEIVDRIEKRLEGLPGIAIAGAGYRGSGLPDCISQGQTAARKALDHLAANPS